jgi:rubrerythrin
MGLSSFGSILTFAEEMEEHDREFYASSPELFLEQARECQRNIQLIQRTRRESVTEMILEPIQGFSDEPFRNSLADEPASPIESIHAVARRLEERALRFYSQAAEKIQALPEVSRVLNQLAKKRARRLSEL